MRVQHQEKLDKANKTYSSKDFTLATWLEDNKGMHPSVSEDYTNYIVDGEDRRPKYYAQAWNSTQGKYTGPLIYYGRVAAILITSTGTTCYLLVRDAMFDRVLMPRGAFNIFFDYKDCDSVLEYYPFDNTKNSNFGVNNDE